MNFTPTCGTHISRACEQAVALAAKHNERVDFSFNGIDLTAYTADHASDVEMRYHQESDRRRREYEASPEFLESQRRRKIAVDSAQREVTRLVNPENFPTTEPEWMEWAASLANAADDVDVKFNRERLSIDLLARGWKENAHVTVKEEVRKRIDTEPTVMAEYIMGQVIGCLNHGMPPHPVTTTFVEKYRKLVAKN